jgi:uncharacterized protein YkwD
VALAAFALGSLGLVGGLPSPAGTLVEPWIDTTNREAVAVAWAAERDRPVPDMDWTGSHDGCDPGVASRDLALATVGRVNFYRAMAGVPASVRLDDDYSAKAQHTALTMSATGVLSHAPDDSFACLDATAREGAANSNLYLGRIGPTAIDGYIEDPGERNRDVGHRNTILHPPTTAMGVGHVAGTDEVHPANALWVFDEGVFDDQPPLREAEGFVAWPPRGHVPAELVHPRWSFGLVDADFDAAEVTMAVDGRPIRLEVVTRHSLAGYVPSPIIVWEPDPADLPALVGAGWPDGPGSSADIEAVVAVTGVVVEGRTVDFTYRVSVMAPEEPSLDGVRMVEAALRRAGRAADLLTATIPLPAG